MLERNDTAQTGTSGQRDTPDERRALGVHPRPGGLVGARALDEQAEGRRVRIRRNRYELQVGWRRTFPTSDGDGLDDDHRPGEPGKSSPGRSHVARSLRRVTMCHSPEACRLMCHTLPKPSCSRNSSGFAIPARTCQYDDRLPSQMIPKRRIGLWLLTIGRRYR
jgi:hypothetical protein